MDESSVRSRCAGLGQDNVYCCGLSSKQIVRLAVNGDAFLFASVFVHLRQRDDKLTHNAISRLPAPGIVRWQNLSLLISNSHILGTARGACKVITSMLETLDGWLAQGGDLKAINEHHSPKLSVQRTKTVHSSRMVTRARREGPATCPAFSYGPVATASSLFLVLLDGLAFYAWWQAIPFVNTSASF